MKKGFTTFLSALKANTPPCKKGHPSLRFLSLFLILFLAVGNAWAAEVLLNQSDGSLNAKFKMTGSVVATANYTVDGTNFSKYVKFGGAYTTPVGVYETNKIAQYDATTNELTVEAWFYNKSSSKYKGYVSIIEEGNTKPTIHEYEVGAKSGLKVTETFTPSKNATIYIHTGNNSNLFLCQAQVTETGSPLLKGGEIGYTVNLEKHRLACNKALTVLDGIEYKATSNQLKVLTSSNLVKLKVVTEYIKFDLDVLTKVSIKASGTYSVTNSATYNSEKAKSGNQDIILAAGTWYICPNGSNTSFTGLSFLTPPAMHTITLEYADGVTADGSISAVDGEAATKPTDPTWEHHRFDGWYNDETPYDWTANVTDDLTLTAHWTQLYTISFAAGEGGSGDAPAAIADKAAGETFTVPANTFTAPDGKVFEKWNDGTNDYDPDDTYTVGTNNVTLTAVWRTPSTMYAINKGAHKNGDFTIAPASQEAGEIVTLEATPNEDYLFSAWEVVKTEDASTTGITVDANGQFTMPAYAVTVNATFVADTRAKVLYVTNNNETTTKASDKLYEALKDDYRVTIVDPASTETVTNYALVVLHESVGGSNYNAAAVAAAKGGSVPVLNTKSYFYNDGRWNWGTPNAGKTIKGATQNNAYCNIASHPLFDGLTITDGFFDITDEAAAKCMQPIGEFTSGKEGYTLATTPNNGEGNGCAIHELTPEQRGASAGKYLMISVSNDKLNALNANGQKLFQNAAAYLIGSTSWTPVLVPTTPDVAGTTAYSAGETIELTASATGESATTTYTWYKGATLEAAKEAGAIKAAKTIAENGNVYSKAECVVGDAGIYWCVISNGTDCEANVSVEITVSNASYNVSFESAYGTPPVATSGVSYTLPELTKSGWVHQGWTASIDVTVDEAVVTAGTTIANGKMAIFGADVTFTAVWKQIFAVTFNMSGHGDAIDPQDIISGAKATKPTDPTAIGWEFGGWFTDNGTFEAPFDFNTPITAATPLYAKWTEFEGCAWLVPETSGNALHVGDNVSVQSGSKGATIAVVGMKTDGSSIAYSTNGLSLNGGSADVISVTLNSDMAVGTTISLKLVAAGTGTRGLSLYDASGNKINDFTCWVDGTNPASNGAEGTFTYTVKAGDGLDGTNIFRLQRNNSVYLKCLKVESCGAAITYHNLTSAVVPAGKGAVTLGASSVREGYTTTATYSDIDPLYEFVNWTVSGAGASVADATANPATITVGTEDAVVTLNLRQIPVKFTVKYYDGATLMDSEQVAVNENPTASDIVTAKRGYVFEGWATSSTATASDVIALNTITSDVTTTINLYAVYTEIPCPTEGTVFSMTVTDPAGTQYEENNDFGLEIGATYLGGKAYSGSKNTTKRIGEIDQNGEYSFNRNSEVTVKVAMDCALQEGDVITFTTSTTCELKIQKVAGTDLVTTSGKKYVIPAESPLIGEYDFYLMRGNSQSTIKTFKVTRPAVYDVTFNMMGHGDQVAAIEDVLDGHKIAAPSPAPTDADYRFGGWYKENTLANEWDFDNDVVTDNITLYAKWVDKSDATLKSLKYGTTEIALEAGVYTYAVNLSPLATDVPALTAVPSNPNATADVTNAAALDGEGHATSTVLVTPEEGGSPQTYTVNFTKLHIYTELADVTETTSWNWNGVATDEVKINDVAVRGLILANYIDAPNFEKLEGQENARAYRSTTYPAYQGTYLRFHATKPGRLTMNVRNSSGSPKLYVNGGDPIATLSDTRKDYNVIVPAGDVIITSTDGDMRIYNMTYKLLEELTPDYTRDVRQGYYGTICLPNGGVMVGASIFEIAYKDASKIYFDEILNGKMEAGVPYIFLPNEGADKLAVFYTDEANASAGSKNGLVGYYDNTDDMFNVPIGNYILLNNQYCEVVGTNAYIMQNYSYIVLDDVPGSAPAPAPGRRRVTLGVNGQQVATGVDQVQGDNVPTKMIINGQLFILRGEKMYDAQGKLVK